MKQTLIPLNKREEWTAALQGVEHAFGHTWESCYALHLTTHQPTQLYVFEQDDAKVVCPVAERTIDGHTDIVTPYGFSGFAGNKEVENFQLYWKQFAREAGYVCGYIGLNPIFEKRSLLEEQELSEYNRLFILDLTLPMEVLFSNLPSNRKGGARKLQKIQHQLSTNKSDLQKFFVENFNQFYAEKNASSVYCFSDETLSFLTNLENVILIGVEQEGQIVAVSVFAYTPYVAEYLFNISLPEGKQYTVPLIWWAVNHFQSIQISKLNLGGGVQPYDSLAEFKARFGAQPYPLKSLKQVYDPEAYLQLCHTYHVSPSIEGYFPPYRQVKMSREDSIAV